MAVDPYVSATRDARPRRKTPMPPAKPWRATRPGETVGHVHPQGGAFGYQGPDQGYALHLARPFEHDVDLAPGERWEDVEYGILGVASRRANLFGRAPIKDDVEVALLAWGFLPDAAARHLVETLVRARRPLFADVVHDHGDQRRIAEAVPEDALRLTPAEARARIAAGESLVSL
jgi:hypothetical protein